MEKQMNVLVIAPHPDDESIGCGGTVYRHVTIGDRVEVAFLTSGELGLKKFPREQAWKIRENEATRALKILGIAKASFLRLPDWYASDHVKDGAKLLRPLLKREQPQIIYLPHPGEWHPDHKAALPIVRDALRGSGIKKVELRGYEIWTPMAEPHKVEDITDVLTRKLRAIRAHKSQVAQIDYAQAIQGLNQYRGEITGKMRYAEAFEMLPLKA